MITSKNHEAGCAETTDISPSFMPRTSQLFAPRDCKNSSAATRFSFYADAQKIDAARALVARIHGGVADVVNYDGNGFCWGWSTIGSAHPHALQHGAVVEVGHVDASVGACATLNNMCLERWARRHLYDCRSRDRYLDLVNAASYANMAENDFYNHGNQMCCRRAASVAPHPLPF